MFEMVPRIVAWHYSREMGLIAHISCHLIMSSLSEGSDRHLKRTKTLDAMHKRYPTREKQATLLTRTDSKRHCTTIFRRIGKPTESEEEVRPGAEFRGASMQL
jgi:hypothetical protein